MKTEYIKDESCQNENMRNMFVGNIPLGSTSEELKTFFEGKVGPDQVESAAVVPAKKAQKFLMGFAKFTDCNVLDDLFLKRTDMIFKGQKLDIIRAVSKDDQTPGARDRKCQKIFIASIPIDGEGVEEELTKYFQDRHDPKYGQITEFRFPKNKETGKLKGIGFLNCSTTDLADRIAIQHRGMVFRGRKLDIKKSVPTNDGSGAYGGYGEYDPYAYDPYGYGGYGPPPVRGRGGRGAPRGGPGGAPRGGPRGRGPRGAARGVPPARGGRGAPRGKPAPPQAYGGGYGDGGYGAGSYGYEDYSNGGGWDEYGYDGYQEYDTGYYGAEESYAYAPPARGRGMRARARGARSRGAY